MSYQTYQEQRAELERTVAKYENLLPLINRDERPEGYAATEAMAQHYRGLLTELNMSYYGTGALFQ